MNIDAFHPLPAATVNISVSSASANVKIVDTIQTKQIRVYNDGTATVWIAFGIDNTVTASTSTSIPIGSGVTEIHTKHTGPIWVAAIAAGSTGSIYFTPGEGI